MQSSYKATIQQMYLQKITDKIALLQNVLNDLQAAAANETKSTAGDKHETALAMLQIEQANKRQEWSLAQSQKKELENLLRQEPSFKINSGSFIKTNRGYFYLGVSLGKLEWDGIIIQAISTLSPVGKALMGRIKGENFIVNGNSYLIESIE